MIRITNTETGITQSFKGIMMVAPNGMVYIKDGKKSVWASANTDFVAIDEDAEVATQR